MKIDVEKWRNCKNSHSSLPSLGRFNAHFQIKIEKKHYACVENFFNNIVIPPISSIPPKKIEVLSNSPVDVKNNEKIRHVILITLAIIFVSAAVFTGGLSVIATFFGTISVYTCISFIGLSFSLGWMGVQYYKNHLHLLPKMQNDKPPSKIQRFRYAHPALFKYISSCFFYASIALTFLGGAGIVVGLCRGALSLICVIDLVSSVITTSWLSLQAYKKYYKVQFRESCLQGYLRWIHRRIEEFYYTHPLPVRITTYAISVLALCVAIISVPGVILNILQHRIEDMAFFIIKGISSVWKTMQGVGKLKKYYHIRKADYLAHDEAVLQLSSSASCYHVLEE